MTGSGVGTGTGATGTGIGSGTGHTGTGIGSGTTGTGTGTGLTGGYQQPGSVQSGGGVASHIPGMLSFANPMCCSFGTADSQGRSDLSCSSLMSCCTESHWFQHEHTMVASVLVHFLT